MQDALLVDAIGMRRQTSEYDAAMRLLMKWWPQSQDKRLGELLQLIPSDVAAEVLAHLHNAGGGLRGPT